MTASVSELVTNPWSRCELCDVQVHSRRDGVNHPCGHTAAAVSMCPTWRGGLAGKCLCRHEAAAAEALQDALEEGDRAAIAERGASRVIEQAERWRPNLWCWIAFAVLVALVLGSLATLGTGR